ncbi:hypothetical protein GCM10027291_06290 [Telluribacter humicola]
MEEQVLLRQICLEGTTTTEEKLLSIRDAEFIEHCLTVQTARSLMGLGKQVSNRQYRQVHSHLLEKEIAECYELGLMPTIPVGAEDIISLEYLFRFRYSILNASGQQRTNYKSEIMASTEDTALLVLQDQLRKKSQRLKSVDEVDKQIYSITIRDGSVYRPYQIELIDEKGEEE